MVKKESVSVKRQTIYALIPSVDIWAFYRIQKLRKFILIALGLGFAFSPISLAVSSSIDMSTITNPFDLYSNPIFLMYMVGMIASLHGTLVYFIRRWSKKWNEQFVKPTNSEFPANI